MHPGVITAFLPIRSDNLPLTNIEINCTKATIVSAMPICPSLIPNFSALKSGNI